MLLAVILQNGEVLQKPVLVFVGADRVRHVSGAVLIRPGGSNPTWISPVAAH